MTQQQIAREGLRAEWPALRDAVLEEALAEVQEETAATAIADRLGTVWAVEDIVRLDRADAALFSPSVGVPEGFKERLKEKLASAAETKLKESVSDNPHARGGKLRRLIDQEVESQIAHLRGQAERIAASRPGGTLASPDIVRRRTIQLLSSKVATELRAMPAAGDESESKRRLKLLTALSTPGGTPDQRVAMLRGIVDGRTASFPYILKYLVDGADPAIGTFTAPGVATLAGFTTELERTFPEAKLIRTCLERYQKREGVLCRFINPESAITAHLAEDFERLPDVVPRKAGGLVMPKSVALTETRRDRFRIPDGVVCAVGLGTLLESLLRQTVIALKLGGPIKARGGELVRRVGEKLALRDETKEALQIVFDQRSLSLRDAMSHSAFFADDEARLDAVIAGLTRTLALLVEDLVSTGQLGAILAQDRWDKGESLRADDVATLTQQFQPGYNLVDQLLDDTARKHVFRVIRILTPDKRLLGWSGFLLWVSGQHDEKVDTTDDAQQFAALFAGLITLEELFRALYEVDKQRVLTTIDDGDGILRCHLAMLDDQPGQLLDPTKLGKLFLFAPLDAATQKSFQAVRAVRDKAFHGAWEALPAPWARYNHLTMKVIFLICSIV
ncbi:hypothetical protein [Fimbriiglobus ruber]|uniref:Uncharacterized protein n=1 Tax=Fimbriiglobus ruber TaxID=1908690 RepID=A0A225E821_9BACT|nr:hypothetical protein [Fimbriiglobus ruber]OWK46918.1 hypothetical protein FRUB_00617 [Fimbriiglobus ruber]